MTDEACNRGDDESQSVEIELMEITASAEVEITDHTEMIVGKDTDDDELIAEEIKEEELEDADVSQDIKSQGKRLLLKDWLIKKLDNQEMPDILSWVNKDEGLFRIKWLHKATDSWQMTADGILFKEWCMYTGKYDPNNENPRKWKANFRCALNSLPDVIIVPSMCVRKGKDAFRVFKILPEKIPEKVREKQESSRKRRREKRESQLRASAKLQAASLRELAPAAVTEVVAEKEKKPTPKKTKTPVTTASDKSSSNTSTGKASTASAGNKAAVLNGMDALCTAAAMMADKPSGKKEAAVTVALPAGSVPVVTPVSAPLAGDIVTYYKPIGPIQLLNKDGNPAVITSPIITSLASPTATASPISPTTPSVSLYRQVTPIQSLVSPPSITSTPGNLLLNVRLAQPSSGVIPQIASIPHSICLKPVTQAVSKSPAPAYLIPKTLLQRQVAVSACNQPARVITVKSTPVEYHTSLGEGDSSSSQKIHSKPTKTVTTTSGLNTNAGTTPTSEVKMQPDMLEYYHLKANVAIMDYANVRFQSCKHTQYIRLIRIYDSDKPSVEVSVSIYPNYSYTIVVHNRMLPGNHEIIRSFGKSIKSVAQLTLLLQRIHEYVTCIGNPEEMPHQLYSDYSSFCSAFQEPDFGAKNQLLRYYSTIRSNSCQLLIKPPADLVSLADDDAKEKFRCDDCSKIRTQILSMRDGSKIPDTEASRKKRLQLLKEYTTKEVLANRIDFLESQLNQLRQYLPADLQTLDGNTLTGFTQASSEFPDSITSTAHCNDVSGMTVVVATSSSDGLESNTVTQEGNVYHVTSDSDIMLDTVVQTAESLLEELSN